jgi:hypothetical protein
METVKKQVKPEDRDVMIWRRPRSSLMGGKVLHSYSKM